MRLIIQRVKKATLDVDNTTYSEIGFGLLVLVGITHEDEESDIEWLANKLTQMRIFSDESGKMNLSAKECSAELLLVSQFTLHASTKKGNRPSFIQAASPDKALPMFNDFVENVQRQVQTEVKTGSFGSDMQIITQLDGPVTIYIDSKERK